MRRYAILCHSYGLTGGGIVIGWLFMECCIRRIEFPSISSDQWPRLPSVLHWPLQYPEEHIVNQNQRL